MDRRLIWFLATLVPALVWSGIKPYDTFVWSLEVAPIFIGVPLIVAGRKQFPLSTLLLGLIWLHALILMLGGHYTYAHVPLGDWVSQLFGWPRNNYDKLGHFAQGFIPAILAREILLRTSPLGSRAVAGGVDPGPASARPAAKMPERPSRWLGFLVVGVCLAFSALYELIEWITAVWSGEAAEEFLGTQGYVWDTQTDMALALVGAVAALLLLSRLHDRSMAGILSHDCG